MSRFRVIPGGMGSLAGGNEPPHHGDMEARVAKLESTAADVRERLARMEVKLDAIDKHSATKHDVSRLESTMIKWFIGTALAICGIGFGLARLLA